MARKNLIRSTSLPYHVFNRVNNREWFPLEMKEVWKIFSKEIFRLSSFFGAKVHQFVLMTNHYHLNLTVPHSDLGVLMKELGESVTRAVNSRSGRVGHLFGGRYRWSLISTPRYFSHVSKYIYRNPVVAGLVENAEDYEFSSLNGLYGKTRLPILVEPPLEGAGDILLPDDPFAFLEWVNTPFKNEDLIALKKALRRREFKLPSSGAFRRPAELDFPRL